MAGRGGRTSSTWKPGEGGKPMGAKAQKTKIKEALGLTGWERLCSYVLNEGAEKYVEEMMKLRKKDYIYAYNGLTEFVKPKLARQEFIPVDPEGNAIQPVININVINSAPKE